MYGLVLALIYIGFSALTNANMPQACCGAANFLFYWWSTWVVLWILVLGVLGLLGIGLGQGVGQKLGLAAISLFAGVMICIGFGARLICAWLVYAAGANGTATSFDQFDTTKLIVAGCIFGVTFILSKLGGSSVATASAKSKSD